MHHQRLSLGACCVAEDFGARILEGAFGVTDASAGPSLHENLVPPGGELSDDVRRQADPSFVSLDLTHSACAAGCKLRQCLFKRFVYRRAV